VAGGGTTPTLAGIDATAIYNLVQAAITANVSVYPISGVPKPPLTQGYLYDETIRGWCQAAHPAIFAVDTQTPTDFPLNVGQVAVLTPTVTVRLVAVGATS
jgi:hypothetical protein